MKKQIDKTQLILNLKEIQPYANNPRLNEGAVEAVKQSIKQCGYIAPIIIDENNTILAGHTRYKALIDLGNEEVDVIKVTGLTEQQKRKYRLLDNKTNELALWDMEKLELELQDLDFEGFDFGFDFVNLSDEQEPKQVEKQDKQEKTITCPNCGHEF